MKLDTLYKRAKTGKIHEYTIEVSGDKYRTISGEHEGTLKVSEWTICEPKNVGRANATTAAQQAVLEAKAVQDYQLKHAYTTDISQVDSTGYVKVMLAESYEDYKDSVGYPAIVQPKLDGVRCVVSKDKMISRENNEFKSCPHILEALAPLFRDYPTLQLDGELYNHDFKDDFNAIIKLVKREKLSARQLEQSKEKVQYWIYDQVGRTTAYSEWDAFINKQLNSLGLIGKGSPIQLIPSMAVLTELGIEGMMTNCLNAGFEGCMIRNAKAAYVGGRTSALLKYKRFLEGEFKILKVLPGRGKAANYAAKVILDLGDGKTCESNIEGGQLEGGFKVRLLKDADKVVGKMATVKYQNLTPDGSLRLPYMKAVRDYE